MFYPISLLIPLMVMLPNLLFVRFKPQNVRAGTKKNPILIAAEGVGRFAVMIVPLFFQVHLHASYEIIALLMMSCSLFMYYLGWGRYYSNLREYKLLFAPMLGIPVPLAIAPSLYFLFSAVILHSGYMVIFSVIFAVGHITNSLRDYYAALD
ncbi:hypothetical protein GCM10010912_65640 [Paenibacillus albidus]|uniref:Uncharacterized protein n=1 Tax=Paenibacillus albidus TaxID=2041023 RepID=A0A917D4J3_9BACL|nr:hypothetical protein [Paenibacillus albidus]GGG12084.1 hypothetical protein GCM10010912_65640 [Paenibacillus albidus]